ncbi:GH116 family glycosyl hydrolase [Brachybacterium sp. GCM10030252]|uniref:GH116 family glycosyl hydrolase n=1 Tax=Brachybacterium sp. GCM10030252 TaxID=3273380 RepID=UPI00360FA62E
MRKLDHTQARHAAMPLGGIGTGNVAICADGALRQWQLHNVGNHRGDLPGSFFALRVQHPEPPLNATRILQAPPPEPPPDEAGTPLVTDDHVPPWQRELVERVGGARGTSFRATYPIAEIDYHLDLPLEAHLQAFTPLVPLDVDRSSLPAAMFTFTLISTASVPMDVTLGAAMQNPVGHDGLTAPDGVHAAGYGGNTNRLRRQGAWTSLLMENAGLDPVAPGAGSAVLSCDVPSAAALAQWTDPHEFLDRLAARTPFAERTRSATAAHMPEQQPGVPAGATGPSPAGSTWNGGLAAAVHLDPGASATVRLVIAWHFPNRYVNFPQPGPFAEQWGPSRFWLGNLYATRYADALAVTEEVQADWDELEADTRAWTDLLTDSTLDEDSAEHMAAQAVVVRSPTCFRGADGTFYGFEGVNGASTGGHSGVVGGSCPLNCTHVWNYAHAVAALFPQLERSMRETELDTLQAPDGSVPHRLIAPTYLPQLWDVPIGGPRTPALDGMLGVILKTYRELRSGAVDTAWLERYWDRLRLLMAHIRSTWDPDGTGVLRGIQPSTHDIDLTGVNTFMGTLWLAALRAQEEMARLCGENAYADELRELFEGGSNAYDALLFNGEYYIQHLEPEEQERAFQWGRGCLADQLIGQWWAHELDLGHLLPAEHVRSALRAIVRHNLRRGFHGFEHTFRVFADRDDTGLLVCSWPTGGRPEVPIRYADEVWTGTEQQVAAHCLREGLTEEASAILHGLWNRYDGSRRNPFNHIECGDHYVRSMSGWSVLDAQTGRSWDATTGILRLTRPADGARVPVLLGTAWGYARAARADGSDGTHEDVELVMLGGSSPVRSAGWTVPS